MLFDTHAHYDDDRFDEDRDKILSELKNYGVTNIVNIGSSMKTSKSSVELANKYDFVYATVGVHPSETGEMTEADIEELKQLSKNPKVKAIGEIGLDYHYLPDDVPPEVQRKWFARQLDLAKELSMPVVIHDRESKGECLEILKEKKIGFKRILLARSEQEGYQTVGSIESKSLSELAKYMLHKSNNLYADAIAKTVAAEFYKLPATYHRTVNALRQVLNRYANINLGNTYLSCRW